MTARSALLLATQTLLYVAGGKLGLALAFDNQSASPVWPPTGIALALCLLFGRPAWPAIVLGAFLVNVTTTGHVPSSITIALGNTAEAALGAWMVLRFAGGRDAFVRAPNLVRFVALACILAPAVAATVGVGSLWAFGMVPLSHVSRIWFTWWLGDAVGALILTPVLVGWVGGGASTWAALKSPQFLVSSALLVATGSLVFVPPEGLSWPGAPLAFVCLPALVGIAYLHEPHLAATSALLLAGVAIYGTVSGSGPFVSGSPGTALLMLQGFMGICTCVALALSAVVAERREAELELLKSHRDLAGANDALSRVAGRDPLTGLLNRAGFELVIQEEQARAELSGSPIACFLLDCDDFKSVNDRHGHEAGDRVLVAVAQALARSVRPADHVARVGGDEFAALLPAADLQGALAVAERVRLAVAAAGVTARMTGPIRVACSVGVAMLPPSATTVGELLVAADGALARSKSGGKNASSIVPTTPSKAQSLLILSIVRLADGAAVGEFIRLGAEPQELPPAAGRRVLLLDAAALPVADLAALRVGPGTVVVVTGRGPLAALSALRAQVHALGGGIGVGAGVDLDTMAALAPDLVMLEPRSTRGIADDPQRLGGLARLVDAVHAAGAETFALGFEEADRPILAALGVLIGHAGG